MGFSHPAALGATAVAHGLDPKALEASLLAEASLSSADAHAKAAAAGEVYGHSAGTPRRPCVR